MNQPDDDPVTRAERQIFEEEAANNRSTAGTGPIDEERGDELGAEVEAAEEEAAETNGGQ